MSKDMKKEKSPLEEIRELEHKLPAEILEDVNNRMNDWFQSGGKENDHYIENQLRYVKRVVNHLENNKSN